MPEQTNWDERYQTGDLPWDSGVPSEHLVATVNAHAIRACPALVIGCGTGTNAIWLAENGFEVTAVDVSPVAVEQAEAKIAAAGVSCKCQVLDILSGDLPGAAYGFAFDRGCFHSFGESAERARYADVVRRSLREDGLWLSLIGSTDGPPREMGPPRRSLRDIAEAVEPCFEVLDLRTDHFHGKLPDPPRNWVCLMRKREKD